MLHRPAWLGWLGLVAWSIAAALSPPESHAAWTFQGVVQDGDGNPVTGAMLTFRHGEPAYGLTIFSDENGTYRSPELDFPDRWSVRVRRIGWKDLRLSNQIPTTLELELERETDPARLAAQLPANHWSGLVLERLTDGQQREEFKRQCGFCHQQGSLSTRRQRTQEEWQKLIALMGRMGGMISRDLRESLPGIFIAAYDPENAIPKLTAGMADPDFAPPPSEEVRRALIEEWDLGGRASMQHDITVHPDGRIYSVDMAQDKLYRLDPEVPGGGRETWDIPRGNWPLGGAFAAAGPPVSPNSNSHVGPHSLQVAPDGAVWITLALGNQLARFDPEKEEFSIHELETGYYPHTLRFGPRGRIWYTLSASNHVGVLDPATGEQHQIRLPAGTLGQAVILRMMPFMLWLGRYVDIRGAAAAGDGISMPIPYGIDIAPDGSVWFSQLNEHRIGRVDPDSFEIELVDTPFPAPRRLRFDSGGRLWIPSFSGALIARFDPETRDFKTWELPIDPPGSETPYALHVDRSGDTVWICGTSSDSLIRFEPDAERFTVYPLPTRVTYTREVDFDVFGRVWTSNSNSPAWHIEGGFPRLLRLDPEGGAPRAVRLARQPSQP